MIQIDELHIRIPGISEEEGTSLGQKVAEKVAAALPDNYVDYQMPEMRIQLSGELSNDTTAMADRISDQIIKQIKLATL